MAFLMVSSDRRIVEYRFIEEVGFVLFPHIILNNQGLPIGEIKGDNDYTIFKTFVAV